MNSALQAKYETWLEKAVADPDLKPELEAMAGPFTRTWSLVLPAFGVLSALAPTG